MYERINELVDKVDKTKSNAMILRYLDMEFGCCKQDHCLGFRFIHQFVYTLVHIYSIFERHWIGIIATLVYNSRHIIIVFTAYCLVNIYCTIPFDSSSDRTSSTFMLFNRYTLHWRKALQSTVTKKNCKIAKVKVKT